MSDPVVEPVELVLETPVAKPPNPPAVQSDDPAALKAKIELLKRDLAAKAESNARLDKEVSDLRKLVNTAGAAPGAGSGKPDVEARLTEAAQVNADLMARITTLETTLQEAQIKSQQEAQKSAALSTLVKAKVRAPEQMYDLLKEKLGKDELGRPTVLYGGVEVPLESHLSTLKKPDSGWEHHFLPENQNRGMGGFSGVEVPSGGGSANPFSANSWNRTVQMMLEMQDPEQAALLKAEAQQG
jgi:hypothetical protein